MTTASTKLNARAVLYKQAESDTDAKIAASDRIKHRAKLMTTMISELYEALVDAGASEAKAKQAAEALSAENLSSKDHIADVKQELAGDIAGLDEKLSGKITELDKKMAVMQWMLGATLAGVVSILVKIFFAA